MAERDETPAPDAAAPIAEAEARLAAAFGTPAGASVALLAWYDRHGRDLPWRTPPGSGARPDPYRVWLSEIMLQQTAVATVRDYFARFVARWPGVHDLAAAPLDDVLHAWQGLGYYARARNLHRCARTVAQDLGGAFPDTEEGLRALPGIGAYTAAAVAAIAFDRPAAAVDGNVERLMARLHAVRTPLPAARPRLRQLAALIVPQHRPGDHAQAAMDLGATVCTPRAPKCPSCPWSGGCAARRLGLAEALPRRAPKAARPVRHGIVWWIERPDGRVMLRRRPDAGLLGGMMEFPGTAWTGAEPAGRPPLPVAAEREAGRVSHVFTHFRLELVVRTARTAAGAGGAAADSAADIVWEDPARLDRQALPTVMKKVAQAALGSDSRGRDKRGRAAGGAGRRH